MRWMAFGLALIAAAAAQAPGARAALITFATPLSGPNEVPPNASPGTGTAIITIDDVANSIRFQVGFDNLVGTTGTSKSTVAHVHCCTINPFDITQTAIPAIDTPTLPGFPAGVTSGTYDHTFDLTDAATYNPAFVTANGGTAVGAEAALIAGLEAGKAYFNIHSVQFGSGEIRGFLAAVPEPSSLLLLAGAFLGMVPIVRRRYSNDRA